MSLLRLVNIRDTIGNALDSISGALKTATHDGDGNKITSSANTLNISLHDGDGNPIGSLKGALDIHDADVHNVPVNEYFSRPLGVNSTLTVAANAGDTQVTVLNGAVFSVGDFLGSVAFPSESIFKQITAIAGNVITLDAPIDNSYPVGAQIDTFQIDMNVLGTLASPVSFKFNPAVGQTWHIVRFLFSMTHGTNGDLGLFGNLPALTNGAVLRGYDGATNTYRTFMNVKTNADLKNNMYDVDFDSRSGGGGTYGTSGRGSIKIGTGAVPVLNADNGDFFEILIQDDLTALDSFRTKVQGHIEGA